MAPPSRWHTLKTIRPHNAWTSSRSGSNINKTGGTHGTAVPPAKNKLLIVSCSAGRSALLLVRIAHQVHRAGAHGNRDVEEAEHHFVPALLAVLHFLGRIRVVRIVGRVV